jgi:5'-nucleotidase
MKTRRLSAAMLAAGVLALLPAQSHAHQGSDDEEGPELREHAAERVEWHHDGPRPTAPVKVRLLTFNDFHGQLSAKTVGARPAGGAAVLAAYLRSAQAGVEDRTFIVHAGDHVGASPPNSALLQDEPAISFLNTLTNRYCHPLDAWSRLGFGGEEREEGEDRFEEWLSPRCNVLGVTGNHEYDEGLGELRRLLEGGNHPAGPFLDARWRGARYPTLVANVVDAASGRPVLPPYLVKRVEGVPVAFIGLVLKETPTIVTPSGVAGLAFLDEADAANAIIARLKRRGVHAFVVVIHQGGFQSPSFAGATGPVPGGASDLADLQKIITRLDDDVDVVVSGHRHAFTNALLATASGKKILVTQAFSASTAYAQIDLELDPGTRDVVSKTAVVPTTWGDVGPGLTPDPTVAALVAAADARVAPLVTRQVGVALTALTRTATPAGEHALGDLIADAQRAAVPGAVAAFMNPGGVRADLDAGPILWGELFTIQPFGNSMVGLTLTGAQVKTLLEQQWAGQTSPKILQVSGLTYSWSASAAPGSKVSNVVIGTAALDLAASYRVAVNNFLAGGGDNFVVLKSGLDQVGGAIDLDALVAYVGAQPGGQVVAPVSNRITLLP